MTILASAIIEEVARRLNDTNNASLRWSGTDLLNSLNDAQKMVAEAKPEASIQSAALELVAGFDQVLPADGKKFLALVYDLGTDGATKGKAIVEMQQMLLDMMNPSWRSQAETASISYFAPDTDFPKRFLVYPPNTGTGYALCRYLSIPIDCATTATNITIGDEYKEPLILGTLWFALAESTEIPELRALRQEVFKDFSISIGVKVKTDEAE